MWSSEVTNMIIAGIGETLYMTLVSTIAGYIIGLPMGIVLTVTDKDGIRPNALVYKILDVIVNIVRSIPFIILLVLLIPFTRLLVGKSYGSTATIVPLVVAAAPYIARMVESSLKEVDAGVIEAARSMGASDFRIITKVLLVEANISPGGSNYFSGNHSWIFCHVWCRWRRRTGSYRDPVWIYQMADGYHDRHGYIAGRSVPDIPDYRNDAGKQI